MTNLGTMNKLLLTFFLLCTLSASLTQYYDTSAMRSIHQNKTASEGDMYLDTVHKIYRIGMTNGELGYITKAVQLDSTAIAQDSLLVFYFSDGTSDSTKISDAVVNSWSIDGNSNINNSTNFIGTTNSRDLPFRVNNSEKMRLFSLTNPSLGIGLTTLSGINGGASSYSGPTIFLGNAANLSSPTGYDFIIDHDNNSTVSKFRLRANGDAGSAVVNILTAEETGDVGIGNDNPNFTLSLYRPGDDANWIQIANDTTGDSGTDGFYIGINNKGSGYVWNAEKKPIHFYTSNTVQMTLEDTGNLKLVQYPESRADDTTGHLNMLYTDVNGVVKSARREIIPPTAFINASSVGASTFNYYTYYAAQLTAAGLTPIPLSKLDFYVFSYDPSVFNTVSISATGILSYNVFSPSSTTTFIDVRFYTK